ncbi:MAG: hypothetical protein GY853_04165 [PVC group bacterium]|nr:hypothetical protein [PVC group bacterium]
MKIAHSIIKIGCLFVVGGLILYVCNLSNVPKKYLEESHWEPDNNNPIIKYGQEISDIIWNDPCVIKEDNIYRMWLSGGTGKGINHVRIYQATSNNGLKWKIDPNPVLVPGSAGQWDDEKVETPMVIKVGETYHMYYSGFNTGDKGGQYQIGHAVSSDGTTWAKDSQNPVIMYTNDAQHWGFYGVAEPGAVYNVKDDKIYLYYVATKIRDGYQGGNPNLITQHGICLAFSPGNDGSDFTHYDSDSDGFRDAVLVQSLNYPPEMDYRGYSTPFIVVDNEGIYNLFYDVVVHSKYGGWRQTTLARATSFDGKSFVEVERDIIVSGVEKWTQSEVRAPSVMQEGDRFKMWYAGHSDWFKSSGIGYAVRGE